MHEPFLVALPKGDDLLEAITRAFSERGIRKASFNLIGLVTRAVLSFFDIEARQYRTKEFHGPHEIVACSGNVSERDGEVFVHSHIVVADDNFVCSGGHLMPGSVIFVAELYGTPVPGPVPVRVFDKAIGLALWSDV